MISVSAHFDGKAIIPDEPLDLPQGQPLLIQVEPVRQSERTSTKSAFEWFAENAVDDLSMPSDLAHQHDHYLYGTPKKEE